MRQKNNVRGCEDSVTIDEAIQSTIDMTTSADGLELVRQLELLRELDQAPLPSGGERSSGPESLAATILSRTKHSHDPAWIFLHELVEVSHYVHLVRICASESAQREGAKHIHDRLNDLETRLFDASVDRCLAVFIRKLIAKWKIDVTSISTKGNLASVAAQLKELEPNPFACHAALSSLELLIDRREAVESLHTALSYRHIPVIEITAPPLCGSTSLFRSAFNSLASQDRLCVAYIDVRDIAFRGVSSLRLASALYDALSIYDYAPPPRDELSKDPLRTIEVMIRNICGSYRQVIVGIDHVDVLDHAAHEREQLRKLIQHLVQLNHNIPVFGVVLIGTIDQNELYKRLGIHNVRFITSIQLDVLGNGEDLGSVAHLLNSPCTRFLPRFTPKAIAEISYLSGRVPFLIQLFAWNIYQRYADYLKNGGRQYQRQEEDFRPEPLFTVNAVRDCLSIPTFQQGWRHYVSRLCQLWGDDWPRVLEILNTVAGGQSLRQEEIWLPAPDGTESDSPMAIIGQLEMQRVLRRHSHGPYTLRLGLLKTVLLERFDILKDLQPLVPLSGPLKFDSDGGIREFTSDEFTKLHAVLVSSLSLTDLKMMLRLHCGWRLEQISTGGTIDAQIFEVIEWCEQRNFVDALIDGAWKYNPGNEELRVLRQRWKSSE